MRKLHKTIKARLDGHTVGWGSENDRRQRCYATLPGSRAQERLRAALNFHVSYYSGKRARADESMNWGSLLELDPSNCPDDTMAALGRVVDHAHNIVPDRYVVCGVCVCVCVCVCGCLCGGCLCRCGWAAVYVVYVCVWVS